MKTLYLCGAGNPEGVRLSLRVNEQQRRWDQIVLLDDDSAKVGKKLLGVPVVGGFDLLAGALPGDEVQNLVTRTSRGRKRAREKIAAYDVSFASILSPDVDLMGVELEGECTVYGRATLGAESVLEEGTVVWMGSVVGHESRLGRNSIVAANAVLNARVNVGEGVYIGTNATVLPEVSIGDWAIIGAGSVVMGDVPAGVTAIGVPAEIVDFGNVEGPVISELDEVEEIILTVMRGVMHEPSLAVEDNFFFCGGTSLEAMRVKTEIEQMTGGNLPLVEIMRHPSARSLAAFLCEPAMSN